MNGNTEYLYHYTSLNGLTGIIEDKKIWATHSKFLNDLQEIKEGYEYFINNKEKILESILSMVDDSEISHKIKENIELRFEEFNLLNKVAIEDEAIFIASFTKKRDNLTHWLSYGSKETSYCLKINKNRMESHTHVLKDTQKDICSVDYIDTDLENAYFKTLSSNMFEGFLRLYKLENDEHKDLDLILGRELFNIYLELLFTCSSIKNKKYEDEKEDRLVIIEPANFSVNGSKIQNYYSLDNNSHKHKDITYSPFTVEYRKNNGILIPYVAVPFDISFIEEIIIGPSNSPEEAKIGLDYFCKQHKLEPKITLTKCPFRAL